MKRRTNIVLITTDQQRQDALGCYGNPTIRTPVLDSFARAGMRWDRAYVANPVCGPSRACMLTGRYPRSHGLTVNGKSLPLHEVTLAARLRDAGYDTAVVGKVHLGPTISDNPACLESQWMQETGNEFYREWHGPYYGFDDVRLSVGHGTGGCNGHYGLWLQEYHPEALAHFESPERGALQPPSGAPFGSLKWGLPKEAHSSIWTANQACSFIERYRTDTGEEKPPFLLWVSFQDPHAPLACPAPHCDTHDPRRIRMPIPAPDHWEDYPPHFAAKFGGTTGQLNTHAGGFHFPGGGADVNASAITEAQTREMIAHYYGMINLVDEQTGRILDALRGSGLEEDTIVVFTSDHGELLGDHGLWMKGPYHYEGLIKVPLLWRWPGRIGPDRSTPALYSHVDLAPTLLDLVDVPPVPGMQGVSHKDSLLGVGESAPGRSEALCEFRIHHELPALNVKTYIEDRYKLTVYAGYDFGEMFDLQADQQERVNLWNDPHHRELKQSLQARLYHLLMNTEDPLPVQLSDH